MSNTSLPKTMQAMVLEAPGKPLVLKELPLPLPAAGQVLIKIKACGVCRTDLHILDGELAQPKLPLVPGHEIVGTVAVAGNGVTSLKAGNAVGVPWLAYTCGQCKYCLEGRENLCANALFTGYTMDGGYAAYTVAWAQYCIPLPPAYANAGGAPLLCAGLIGYRSWQMAGQHAQRVGVYGFGAAAHILTQVAVHQRRSVYAFTRPGDVPGQAFARQLGAVWAGSSGEAPPVKLDAAIIFAPDGALVPEALRHVDKGGCVVCGGIHMSDIPRFPYQLLWEERSVCSVANLTRRDGTALFEILRQATVQTTVTTFPLHQANEALGQLRRGGIQGAAVLVME